DRCATQQRLVRYRAWWVRSCPKEFRISRRCAEHRCRAHVLAVISPQDSKTRLTKLNRFFEHRIENGGQITRRRVDNLENLGGRGLLVQCLAGLADEARVLDGDDSLMCKRAN